MADAHKNFAYSTVATAPSPATTGTTLTVAAGQGALFPVAPFNCTVWGTATQPTLTGVNATTCEIIRVTSKGSGDDWTITRLQEGLTTPRTIVVGDQIAASITAKTLTDIEDNSVNSWSPFILNSAGNGVQSIMNSSSALGTGSLYVFPVTVQFPVKFNQIILPVQLSMVTSATALTATNYFSSKFGIYSMVTNTPNTLLSLISSNSFGISLTMGSNSLTFYYPTTTQTAGYGYGSLSSGASTYFSNATQMSSYIPGTRAIGLQFNGEMTLSGGQYWIGIMHQRTATTGAAAVTAIGLSNVGIIGQIMNPINQAGTVSGVLPIGIAGAQWAQNNTHISAWFGRLGAGFVSATSVPNFGGTGIPDNISLIHLGAVGANSMGSILPNVTFCST